MDSGADAPPADDTKQSGVVGAIGKVTAMVLALTAAVGAFDAFINRTGPVACKIISSRLPWCPTDQKEDEIQRITNELNGVKGDNK
jgi:hypothetical protein